MSIKTEDFYSDRVFKYLNEALAYRHSARLAKAARAPKSLQADLRSWMRRAAFKAVEAVKLES